jgi:enoyl-CoA hydratase
MTSHAPSVRTECSTTGFVWTVVLDRPTVRNAVDQLTADALHAAFVAFENDPVARVAVLFGAGGNFCAGADLKALAATGANGRDVAGAGAGAADGRHRASGGGGGSKANAVRPVDLHDRLQSGPMGPTRLQLSKPVIAAIEGAAVAGGLELACWADLRVADLTAVLGVFCRRWGVPLVDGGTVRLPRIVGHGRAMDLILTGRAVGADEALAMGLIDRLVPTGTARRAAESLAEQLCSFPQACMRADRVSAREQWGVGTGGDSGDSGGDVVGPNGTADASVGWELAALANEFRHGQRVLQEAVKGAGRFAAGLGRGGSFEAFGGAAQQRQRPQQLAGEGCKRTGAVVADVAPSPATVSAFEVASGPFRIVPRYLADAALPSSHAWHPHIQSEDGLVVNVL